ncbi:MAG: hypothetical protein MHM6MM_009468, partial [Cercozoa sp. M6MM]
SLVQGCVQQSRRRRYVALYGAASKGAGDVVQVLLQHGACACDQHNGKSALFAAAAKGSVRCVELLLNNGAAEMIDRAYNGQTPRDIAVEKSHIAVRDLIDRFVASPPPVAMQPQVPAIAATPHAVAPAPVLDTDALVAAIDAKIAAAIEKVVVPQPAPVNLELPGEFPGELERIFQERLDAALQRMEQRFEQRMQELQPKEEGGCRIM